MQATRLVGLLAVSMALLTACFASSDSPIEDEPPSPTATPTKQVQLSRSPERLQRKCEEEFGGSMCMCRIPELTPGLRPKISSSRGGDLTQGQYRFVDLSAGSPTRKLSRRNAPPGFLHVQFFAGSLTGRLGLVSLAAPRKGLAPGDPISERQQSTMSLGFRTWGGRKGELVLAAPYPFGGLESDHVIFVWNEGSDERAISVHGWLPIKESVENLRAIVRSVGTDARCG